MPHIPYRPRPLPQQIQDPATGATVHREPPPSTVAPLALQPLQPDLPEVPDITDLPIVPPQPNKPPVGRVAPRSPTTVSESARAPGMATLSVHNYTVDPAEVARRLFDL